MSEDFTYHGKPLEECTREELLKIARMALDEIRCFVMVADACEQTHLDNQAEDKRSRL